MYFIKAEKMSLLGIYIVLKTMFEASVKSQERTKRLPNLNNKSEAKKQTRKTVG